MTLIIHTTKGYNFIKRNRAKGNGGGVAMYVNSNVDFVRCSDLEDKDL